MSDCHPDKNSNSYRCQTFASCEAKEKFNERLELLELRFDNLNQSFEVYKDVNESWLSDLVDRIKYLENKSNKKPHKCPVCDGAGHIHKSDDKEKLAKNFEFYREYASCPACEGKGIVWG